MKYLFCWVFLCSFELSAASLRAIYGDFNSPPAVILQEGKVAAGFMPDIYQLLANELGVKLDLVAMPRKRLADFLLTGQADIYCRASPEWYPDPGLKWSPPLLVFQDLIISRRNYLNLSDFTKRSKGSVGATLGYVYPKLQPLFSNGQLLRVDSVTPATNAIRLLRGELDTVVLSDTEAFYMLRLTDFKTLVLTSYPIHCMYGPSLSPLQRLKLNRFIQQQASTGVFQKVLDQYREQGLLSSVVPPPS
ncbi:transporter substrate-binding domain-containing protein [Rheinheimera riviphila]|uniref:Transporter substrate-binding domain-containing protein n=1 Tax=Rheinheimera riviphila TaxID=1834037 RepID=A0A437QLG1_9GAMM|nr:transporter substrate-binding domain-containing protein [Rheinheimera riviphila]RVU35354.1 transporter substrate-binding domain-containing protein [Rheinheimera riviphila]